MVYSTCACTCTCTNQVDKQVVVSTISTIFSVPVIGCQPLAITSWRKKQQQQTNLKQLT